MWRQRQWRSWREIDRRRRASAGRESRVARPRRNRLHHASCLPPRVLHAHVKQYQTVTYSLLYEVTITHTVVALTATSLYAVLVLCCGQHRYHHHNRHRHAFVALRANKNRPTATAIRSWVANPSIVRLRVIKRVLATQQTTSVNNRLHATVARCFLGRIRLRQQNQRWQQPTY